MPFEAYLRILSMRLEFIVKICQIVSYKEEKVIKYEKP